MSARVALLLVGALATTGCEAILGYGDLKDRPADASVDSGVEPDASGGSSSGGSSSSGSGSSSGGSSSSSSSGGSSSGSSSGGSSSGSSSGGSSSGSSSGGSSGSSSGTVCKPIGTVPAKDVPPYVAVRQAIGACSPAQIASFITACVDSTSGCTAWQKNPKNSTCQGCLLPSTTASKGALLLNAAGAIVGQNTPGCIALADKVNGPTCAATYEPLIQCEDYGCSQCQGAGYPSCQALIDDNACHTYVTAKVANCRPDFDGGVYDTKCSGATEDESVTAVLDVICGTGG